jgi:serine/threonine protein kinase
VLGTPLYLAPEQALGQAVDARADVYALGAVLYACLTGRPPFIEQSLTAMLLAHAQKEPSPPSLHMAGISPALDAIVLRCLRKKPADRFQDARALRDALLALSVDGTSGATAHPRFSSAAEAPTLES